jgi:hypothetical protein
MVCLLCGNQILTTFQKLSTEQHASDCSITVLIPFIKHKAGDLNANMLALRNTNRIVHVTGLIQLPLYVSSALTWKLQSSKERRNMRTARGR